MPDTIIIHFYSFELNFECKSIFPDKKWEINKKSFNILKTYTYIFIKKQREWNKLTQTEEFKTIRSLLKFSIYKKPQKKVKN